MYFHKRDAQINNATSGGNAEGARNGHPPHPACQHGSENTWRREEREGGEGAESGMPA